LQSPPGVIKNKICFIKNTTACFAKQIIQSAYLVKIRKTMFRNGMICGFYLLINRFGAGIISHR
jgi:hypothetical protein